MTGVLCPRNVYCPRLLCGLSAYILLLLCNACMVSYQSINCSRYGFYYTLVGFTIDWATCHFGVLYPDPTSSSCLVGISTLVGALLLSVLAIIQWNIAKSLSVGIWKSRKRKWNGNTMVQYFRGVLESCFVFVITAFMLQEVLQCSLIHIWEGTIWPRVITYFLACHVKLWLYSQALGAIAPFPTINPPPPHPTPMDKFWYSSHL